MAGYIEDTDSKHVSLGEMDPYCKICGNMETHYSEIKMGSTIGSKQT